MELQEIDVFIEKDGQVRLEVRGVKGAQCLAETERLERALGGEIIKREMTPEANARTESQSDIHEQQGER